MSKFCSIEKNQKKEERKTALTRFFPHIARHELFLSLPMLWRAHVDSSGSSHERLHCPSCCQETTRNIFTSRRHFNGSDVAVTTTTAMRSSTPRLRHCFFCFSGSVQRCGRFAQCF